MLEKLPEMGISLAETRSGLPVPFDPISGYCVEEILVLINPVSSVK
jgi:hypothetical protein